MTASSSDPSRSALLKKAKHHKLKVTVSGSSKNSAGAATKLKSRKVTLKGH